MQTKLTLRMDEELINRAKTHAERTGKSVSQIVADYFTWLGESPPALDEPLTPVVQSLKGILKETDVDQIDYIRYLDEKHR